MSDSLHVTVYFDGTGNNKDNDQPKGTHTNVARLYERDRAQGTNLARNSAHVALKYEGRQHYGLSEKIYFDGVGSQRVQGPKAMFEGATGSGSQNRIEQAYETLVRFHNKNPEFQVDVNVVGFSRGAAQARALANVFIERGVPMLNDQWKATGEYLIPPGEARINKLGLFDTVASYGNPKTESHVAKNLAIHENVASTTHLIAMNEYRDTFPLTSALRNSDNSRITELKFAGAHSQIGGGYRNDVLAAGPLAVMYEALVSAGVELQPLLPEDRQRVEQYNVLIKDLERVQEALIDSRLRKGNEAFRRNPDGSLEVIDNTPFFFQRGTFDKSKRQSQPFAQAVEGRKVIFENDDSLGKLAVQRVGKQVGQLLCGLGDKLKDAMFERAEAPVTLEQARAELFDELAAEGVKPEIVALAQVSELSELMSNSKPEKEYLQTLGLEAVAVPKPGLTASHAVVKIDSRSSSAFADLGFEYEASRIVADAAIGALARAPLDIDDPFMLHDTNGNVVGTLEAVHKVPSFDIESGVLIAIDMQHVAPAAQAGFLYDGFRQAAEWISGRPEGLLKDCYELVGADGKSSVRCVVARSESAELERTAHWSAPEP